MMWRELAEAMPHRARKDRKKWCRGKPGREHVVQRMKPPSYSWATCGPGYGRYRDDEPTWLCWHGDVCTECGKILRMTGWRLLLTQAAKECPDYR